MKYNEDKILKEIGDYIGSTYGQHYAQVSKGTQVQDLLRDIGIDKDFCQANAIKYLCRFGKKDGRNRKDLLKAVHYIVLLMNSEDQDVDTSPSEYGYGAMGEGQPKDYVGEDV
tara:strand:+ start:207 stop:545 length:339 start_codon:yes stop_codon:yes gene_type:complete